MLNIVKLKVKFESNATLELIEAADYYQKISSDLAYKSLNDFDAAIDELSIHPKLFRVRENNYRAILLNDFLI